MSPPRKRIPRVWMAGIWAFVLGLAAALLVLTTAQIEDRIRPNHSGIVTTFIARLDSTAYDWLFLNRGEQKNIPEVVIVAISDQAIDALVGTKFQGKEVTFPFPRALQGELFRKLKADGAKVIAPDITFSDPSVYGEKDDKAFAAALKACGNVILATDFTQSHNVEYDVIANASQFPYAPLRETCLDFAPVNVLQDEDLSVRRFSLTRPNISLTNPAQDEEYPTFAARVAGAYVGMDRQTLMRQLAENRFQNAPIVTAPDNIVLDSPGKTVRINYAGYPKQSCRYIPYDRVIDGTFPSGIFRDKIVLIGGTAGGEHADELVTPLIPADQAKRPGVEIHANSIHTLLSGNYIAMFPGRARTLLIILFALLAAAVTLQLHPLKAFPIIALMVVCVPAISVALFNAHIFYRPTQPIAAILLSYGFQSVYFYAIENRRANETRKRFGRIVGPRVLNKIMELQDLKLMGERAYATVMFTDLQGFTSLSEKMAPSDAVALLNGYMTKMVDILDKYDGTLDKIMGDGVMAYFEAAGPSDRSEEKAVQCALEMQATMVQWRAQCEEMGVPPLKVRIGVHAGEVVIGTMGAPQQMSWTIIGDTVNAAARLEPLNKELKTEILISEAVQQKLSPEIHTQFVGEMEIRGRKEGIRAYSVSADYPAN